MDQDNEVKLIKRAQAGDEEALVALYQKYLNPIYRYIFSHTADTPATEDLTSEVFLKMVRQLPHFDHRSSFKNWLYAITKNTVADYWRQHYQKPTVPLESVAEINLLKSHSISNVDIEQQLKQKEEIVYNILRQLPDNYRRVLELRFLQNYTLQETANELRLTLTNVKVLQYRGLKRAYELSQPYE